LISDCVVLVEPRHIIATVNTYVKMLGTKPEVVGERYTQSGIFSVSEVTALIGFSGEAVGAMIISLSEEVSLKTISKFLYFEQTEINNEVLDGIEEIVNIVSGEAAARFSYQTGLGLPTIMLGEKQRLHGNEEHPWQFIKMKTDELGEFIIGATLKEA